MVSVRCVLSLVVQNDWNVYQLDINNAFFYGELVEDVYMSLPEGYFSNNDKRVCKLQKSLYWLKQVPRKWNEKLTFVLYDILITGNDVFEINKCKDLLSSKFLIKDLGDHKYFLGVEVTAFVAQTGPNALQPETKSSGEAEYRAMSSVACEVIWILKILTELKVKYKTPVEMFCDNNSAIQIAANHVFHERTKHFEIDLFS
ncbi:ribonuclease H-like domain-containing protein [Tanacetum coccineum]